MSNYIKNGLIDTGLSLGNMAFGMINKNPNVPDIKSNKLRAMISQCTYPQNNTNIVIKAAQDVMSAYRELDCDILRYTQNYKQKAFIELKGTITVDYKGGSYGVKINLMIPETYPMQAPFIRIINIDHIQAFHYSVDSYYERFQSKNDQTSYLLNELNTLKNWNFYSNIIDVVKEAQGLMGQKFPFKKKKGGDTNNINSVYQNNQYPGSNSSSSVGFVQPPYVQGFNTMPNNNLGFNNPNNFNNSNYGGFNNPQFGNFNQGFNTNQGFNNNVNQGFNNQGFNGFDNSNQGFNTTGNNFNNPMKQQVKIQIEDFVARSQLFIADTAKNLQYVQNQHASNYPKSQALEIVNKCIIDQNKILAQEIKNMEIFVKANENNKQEDLKDFVKAADELSNQLLEYVCENKASEQTIALLESQFSDDKISLENFLKWMRKLEEDRFVSKVMIKKCIQELKR